MNETIAKWIVEFLVRQHIDDSILDRLISPLPFPVDNSQLKKVILLRRIQTEVSNGTVSEKNLDLLELVRELDFGEGKVASESMKAAYCAVAVDCTVRFLALQNYEKYLVTLNRIWRGRVQKIEKSENPGLISEKLLRWRVDLEDATSDVELRDRILSKNTWNDALEALVGYLAESWKEMGPSYLEKTAENKDKMGEFEQRVNEPAEEQVFGGLENVNKAHNGEIPSDKPSVGNENVNELGEEHVFEGLENVDEAHNGEIPSDKPSVGNENVNEYGKEQVLEGLENVNEAHIGEIPSDKPSVGNENVNDPGEEQVFEGLANVDEAHDGEIPSDKPSVGNENVNEHGEEQVLEALENVNETHKGEIPIDKPSVSNENVNEHGEEQVFEGLQNVNAAHNGKNPSDKPTIGNGNVNEHGEERVFEGLENINDAHNVEIPSDKPSVGNENVNEHGEERVFEGLENVSEAHYGEIPSDKPSVGNEPREEQVFEGLENANKAHSGEIPGDKPSVATRCKQGISRRKVCVRRGLVRESFYGTHSKARITSSDEVDGDTSMNKYECIPTSKVNDTKAALRSSFVDLNAVVRDPLPEALQYAEEVSSDIRKAAGLGGNSVAEMNAGSMNKTDGLDPNRVESNRGDGHEERKQCTNGSQTMSSDPLDFTDESLPNKRRKLAPVNTNKMPRLKKRATRKEWSALEVETLIKGVEEFGTGKWKDILTTYSDIFEDKTNQILRDKWRNLAKHGKC